MSDTDKIIGFAKGLKLNNEEFLEFLQNTEYSEKTLENYQQYMQKANSATSAFSATLKSVAANMAIMLIINGVIKAVAWAWDELNVTVEEQQAKVDELTSSYEGLKSEYDALKTKDNLTQAEQDRLNYLERQLELQTKLLEIETKRLYQNKVGTSWTDIFDGDSLKNKQFDEENAFSSDSFKNQKLKYETTMESYRQNHSSGATHLETQSIETLEGMYDDLVVKQSEFLANMQEAQEATKYLVGEDKVIAEEQAKYWEDNYNYVCLMVDEIDKIRGTYDFNPSELSARLGGSISADELKNEFSSEEIDLLLETEFDKDSSIDELHSLVDTLQAEASKNPVETGISLENLNNQIDSIQSAYKGLTTACEEYNQYGYITADTLQTLLALDSQYLACLIDENGQLAINGQTYQALVQAKLADAEATAVQQAIEELGTVTTEQQINADTTAIGVMAEKGTALATLTGQYAALANVAVSAAQAQALADAYTDASSKNKEEADRIMSNLNAKLALIQNTAKNTSGSFGALTNHLNGFSSASNSAKDSTDALTKSMEKQKEALEDQKDALEKQKQYYEDVAEAVNWFYDKQIEKQEKAIDNLEKQIELIQAQIDIYDGALSAIDRFYEKQIEALEKKKDALDGNNEEVEAAINLEKRQQELLEAKSRKSVQLYTKDKGFINTTDSSAIKTAEENLADAQIQKEQVDIQSQIDKLKEYQALWAEIPSVKEQAEQKSQMIELLGAEWESILLNGRIENIAAFKEQYVALQQQIDSNENLIASYNEKIQYYESLKLEWDNLLAKYTEDTYTQLLIGAFGNDFENELLNGRTERWTQFADDYYNVQVQLKDVTDQIEALAVRMEEYASRIESAANSAVKAVAKLKEAEASASSSSAKLQTPNITTWTAFDKADMVTRISGKASGRAKGGIISKKDAGDYDLVANALKEDHMVAMQEGEAVIPKETVAKNSEIVNSLLSGKDLDLKSLVNEDGVLQRTTPLDTYAMLEKYQNWIVPDSVIMSQMNIPSQDFSKFGMVNNNQKSTTVNFNGGITVQGVQDGNAFAKEIITKTGRKMTQILNKRDL